MISWPSEPDMWCKRKGEIDHREDGYHQVVREGEEKKKESPTMQSRQKRKKIVEGRKVRLHFVWAHGTI